MKKLGFEMRERVFRDGALVFDSGCWVPNALANEGQGSMLEVYWHEQANPTKYLMLLNDTTLAVTDTLATVTESTTPGTNGYSRQQLVASDWTTPALDSGNEQTSNVQKTWTFTGSVPVTHVAGATVSTGTAGLFLFYVATQYYTAVGSARTYLATEVYQVTLRDKQI